MRKDKPTVPLPIICRRKSAHVSVIDRNLSKIPLPVFVFQFVEGKPFGEWKGQLNFSERDSGGASVDDVDGVARKTRVDLQDCFRIRRELRVSKSDHAARLDSSTLTGALVTALDCHTVVM